MWTTYVIRQLKSPTKSHSCVVRTSSAHCPPRDFNPKIFPVKEQNSSAKKLAIWNLSCGISSFPISSKWLETISATYGICYHWWIQDFPDGGGGVPTLKWGAPTYYFGHFISGWEKLPDMENILVPSAPWIPPIVIYCDRMGFKKTAQYVNLGKTCFQINM